MERELTPREKRWVEIEFAASLIIAGAGAFVVLYLAML